MLLKINDIAKNEVENEPENEAGHLAENKGQAKKLTKNEPEIKWKKDKAPGGCFPVCGTPL